MRPVCVGCGCFYRCKKNEVTIEAHAALWSGDLWQCPGGCGGEIIVGVARHPFAESHQPDYQERVATEQAVRVSQT